MACKVEQMTAQFEELLKNTMKGINKAKNNSASITKKEAIAQIVAVANNPVVAEWGRLRTIRDTNAVQDDLRKFVKARLPEADKSTSEISTVNAKSIAEQVTAVNKGKPAEKHTEKELKKVAQATQFIGFGTPTSSTGKYAKIYGDKANTGVYTKDDVVWVSSNGNRPGRVNPVENGKLVNGFQVLDKAIEAGAQVVMDTTQHIANTQRYNIGEVALAQYMYDNGYTRDDTTGAGLWTKNRVMEDAAEVKTTTINGIKISFTSIPQSDTRSLAANTKDGIVIQEGLTAAKVVKYLTRTEAVGRLADVIAVKQQVNEKFREQYGVYFNDVLNGIKDDKTIRQMLLLHEHRHSMQIDKRGDRELFKAEYKKDPVKFELDANVFALKNLGLLPAKVTSKPAKQDTVSVGKEGIQYGTNPEVMLSKGQYEAAQKIEKLLSDKDKHMFMLQGPGGTGKTFVLGQVIDKLTEKGEIAEKFKFAVAATAHAAKDVLGDTISQAVRGKEVSIRKFVALQLNRLAESYSAAEKKAKAQSGKEVEPFVIILDEVGMVDNGELRRLISTVENSEGALKLILLGDRAQLRPIVPSNKKDEYIRSSKDGVLALAGKTGKAVKLDSPVDNYGWKFVADDANAQFNNVLMNKVSGGYLANQDYNRVKAHIFLDVESMSEDTSHMLLEQQRQLSGKILGLVEAFRTEVVEPSLDAESTQAYSSQRENANNALLKEIPTVSKLDDAALSSLEDGTGVVLAHANAVVDSVNTKLTTFFGIKASRDEEVAKYGVFTGQPIVSTANTQLTVIDSKSRITNNTRTNVEAIVPATQVETTGKRAIYDDNILRHKIRYVPGMFVTEKTNAFTSVDLSSVPAALREQLGVTVLRVTQEESATFTLHTIVDSTAMEIVLENWYRANPFTKPAGVEAVSGALAQFYVDYGRVDTVTYDSGKIVTDSVAVRGLLDIGRPIGTITKETVRDSFQVLKPTYASTVHKSQGSTYKTVVTEPNLGSKYMTEVARMELQYVALGRSSDRIVLSDNVGLAVDAAIGFEATYEQAPDIYSEYEEVYEEMPLPVDEPQYRNSKQGRANTEGLSQEEIGIIEAVKDRIDKKGCAK